MKLRQALSNIFILALIVAGAFFPPVWVILIILVYTKRDSSTRKHNSTFQSIYQSSSAPSVSIEQTETIDLNYLKLFKADYLKSAKWDTLRKAILKRDSYTCQGCHSTSVSLEVHHISYIRLGSELPSDLISVCRSCHQAIHDTHGYDYNSTFPLVS